MEDRARTHHIIAEGRARLSVAGVEDVESFDEGGLVLITSAGTLVIKGSGLHIGKLSIEGGELNVEGRLDSLVYEDAKPAGGGLWSRLFG